MPPESRTQEIQREVVSLREHFEELRRGDLAQMDRRFAEQEKAVVAALASADKAVSKAELASEKRQDAGNEIRQAMIDQQTSFVTKIEVSGLERRIAVLEDFISRSAGRSTGITLSGDLTFRLIAAIAALAAIAGIIYGLTK